MSNNNQSTNNKSNNNQSTNNKSNNNQSNNRKNNNNMINNALNKLKLSSNSNMVKNLLDNGDKIFIKFDNDILDKNGKLYDSFITKISPFIKLNDLNNDDLYTLAIIDPDLPENAPNKLYLHLMISNIKGDDITSGTVIRRYHNPRPPFGETHRYFIILLKQDNEISPNSLKNNKTNNNNRRPREPRLFESVVEIMDKCCKDMNLEPLAIRYFKVKSDRRERN